MRYLLVSVLLIGCIGAANAQCEIALDTLDEFDSTRLIAAKPVTLGYLVPTGALAEDLEGEIYTEEAKAIFSYANEKKTRSFFLTIGVVEHKFHMIENDYTVYLKFAGGPIVKIYNEPDEPVFDRDLVMWKMVHTCVIPIDIFHMMKNDKVEKIRIVYNDYKSTIVLSEEQQEALQSAVVCVEQRLNAKLPGQVIKP